MLAFEIVASTLLWTVFSILSLIATACNPIRPADLSTCGSFVCTAALPPPRQFFLTQTSPVLYLIVIVPPWLVCWTIAVWGSISSCGAFPVSTFRSAHTSLTRCLASRSVAFDEGKFLIACSLCTACSPAHSNSAFSTKSIPVKSTWTALLLLANARPATQTGLTHLPRNTGLDKGRPSLHPNAGTPQCFKPNEYSRLPTRVFPAISTLTLCLANLNPLPSVRPSL